MKSGNQRIISVESRGDIMEESISRRKFLGAMAAASVALGPWSLSAQYHKTLFLSKTADS